jgi:esterase/lipase superfamily enzyme
MTTLKLYYATNRNHIGNRWTPDAYGAKFSDDDMENLRFSEVGVEAEAEEAKIKLGSKAMYADVQTEMEASSDVLVYIHGFNVSWFDAVGSVLVLQTMLRSKGDKAQNVVVILFTWPSDGMALPWVSFKSDRSEARGSGLAIGRALLKTRDYLIGLRDRAKQGGTPLCG